MSKDTASQLPLPNLEEEKEAFHKIANIEDHIEFIPRAKELAAIYLSNANFDAIEHYNQFDYTEKLFDERMERIYEDVLLGMHQPHRYDLEVINWSNGKRYRVGRASDAVVKDRLLQLAPFNLMDGVWLQNILQARPSDDVQSRLFKIWSDEVGNGETQQNHSNVYENLLHSQGFNLPPVTSIDFLTIDVAPGAWRAPVFQMCMGLFPQAFFPELIGMTLFLEWEATPSLMPTAKMLSSRGINPLFYSLHVAIDNISEGHGALAKEAVKIYLEEKREEGGENAVQQNWKRIWRGYVTWATAGFNGEGLEIRRLLIDRKSINIGTPEKPNCIPDFKKFYEEKMIDLVKSKAPYASEVHGAISIGGINLNRLFERPKELLDKLLEGGFFDLSNPRNSRFFELLKFEGPMYKVFTENDVEVIMNWLESLRPEKKDCLEPLPDKTTPGNSAQAVIQLINDLAPLGRRSHDELVLPNKDGNPVPLVNFFDKAEEMMAALIRGGWVIPFAPDRSILLTRIIENSGPMAGILTPEQISDLRNWISEGAIIPEAILEATLLKETFISKQPSEKSFDTRQSFLERRPFIGQGAVH